MAPRRRARNNAPAIEATTDAQLNEVVRAIDRLIICEQGLDTAGRIEEDAAKTAADNASEQLRNILHNYNQRPPPTAAADPPLITDDQRVTVKAVWRVIVAELHCREDPDTRQEPLAPMAKFAVDFGHKLGPVDEELGNNGPGWLPKQRTVFGNKAGQEHISGNESLDAALLCQGLADLHSAIRRLRLLRRRR